MDRFERRVMLLSGALMTVFLVAVLRSMSTGAADVPTCLPYDASYLEPRVEQLDDSTYQVFCVAAMWNFEPTEIYIPVGSEVDFYLTTKDVVHCFQIADKGINMMAVYGGVNKTTATFDEPGVYEIICHEYCGSGHQHMRAEVIVNYPN